MTPKPTQPAAQQSFSVRELHELGIEDIGENVNVHRSVLFFSPENVHLGSNARIDCFSVLSAGEEGLWVGNNVHIAAGCYVYGGSAKVVLEDFVGISARTTLYTATDDFTEGALTGPTVPSQYRNVRSGAVTLKKHTIVGSGTVILPGVVLGLAAAVGALSLVRDDVSDFAIVAGVPARVVGTRSKRILELEEQYLSDANRTRPPNAGGTEGGTP